MWENSDNGFGAGTRNTKIESNDTLEFVFLFSWWMEVKGKMKSQFVSCVLGFVLGIKSENLDYLL